jgi:uncharacterized protein (DUF362 family)
MSQVVVVRIPGDTNTVLDENQYRHMLTTGMQAMAGAQEYRPFLKKLFPGGTVGMKANCLSPFNSTSVPLAGALTKILIADAGIEENNIIVWERGIRELKEVGYKLNASSFGPRCFGTDTAGVGYDDTYYTCGKVNSRVSRVITHMIDHSINLPILKHHYLAGLSGGLKNMYGAVNNPNKYHADNCNPFAAEISALEPIKKKHRLTIIDAGRVQYDNGPGYDRKSMAYYGGIIISSDPVAIDRVALEILEKCRAAHKKPSFADLGQPVKYLKSGEDIGLGISDLARIDLKVLTVGSGGKASPGELF